MKPLHAKDLNSFLKRFDNFINGEFRSVEIASPTSIVATFATQDSSREFNWISIDFEFSGVDSAKILDNKKLSFVDMSDGISIINEDNKFSFGIGKCDTLDNIMNSICHIISTSIKYREGSF